MLLLGLGYGFLDGVDLFAEVLLTPLQFRFLLIFATTSGISGHSRGFRRITALQQIFRAYWNQLGFQFTVTTLFGRYKVVDVLLKLEGVCGPLFYPALLALPLAI